MFGPVGDDDPGYWQQDKLRQRDASILDRHLQSRFQGQRFSGGQDPTVRAYAIPKNMQIALRENASGGLPKWNGAANNIPNYIQQAQSRFQSQGGMPNLPDPHNGQRPYFSSEVDASALMAQRVMAQAAQPVGPTHGAMPGHAMVTGQQQGQQGGRVCQLMEGHVFYSAMNLQGGFASPTPLVRRGGQIQGLNGRQFTVEGTAQCYVVDGLQTVDLSRMEPQRLVTLVRVSAPLLGTFMVPQEAVMEMNGGASQRQLLIDSGQQHAIHQRQQWAQQQQAQGLMLPSHQNRQVLQQQQVGRAVNPHQQVQQQGMDVLRRRGLLRG